MNIHLIGSNRSSVLNKIDQIEVYLYSASFQRTSNHEAELAKLRLHEGRQVW